MAKFVFLALALLACAAVAARAQSADCDRSQGPKSVAAVKALVDGDSKVNVSNNSAKVEVGSVSVVPACGVGVTRRSDALVPSL